MKLLFIALEVDGHCATQEPQPHGSVADVYGLDLLPWERERSRQLTPWGQQTSCSPVKPCFRHLQNPPRQPFATDSTQIRASDHRKQCSIVEIIFRERNAASPEETPRSTVASTADERNDGDRHDQRHGKGSHGDEERIGAVQAVVDKNHQQAQANQAHELFPNPESVPKVRRVFGDPPLLHQTLCYQLSPMSARHRRSAPRHWGSSFRVRDMWMCSRHDAASDLERGRIIADEPGATGDQRYDALLGAVVQFACARHAEVASTWVDRLERFLDQSSRRGVVRQTGGSSITTIASHRTSASAGETLDRSDRR